MFDDNEIIDLNKGNNNEFVGWTYDKLVEKSKEDNFIIRVVEDNKVFDALYNENRINIVLRDKIVVRFLGYF